MEAHAITIEKPFSHSSEVFAVLVDRLGGSEVAGLPHGEVEQMMKTEGFELLRVLFEDHLNLRAQAMPAECAVTGSDGETRTHRRKMPRKLMTIFGMVELHARTGWRGDGVDTLCPLDAELNLPPVIDSHGVRRRIAELASKCSFDAVAVELGKSSGATVGKRQLEALTHVVSRDFDDYYAEAAADAVDAAATVLVGGVDATGIAMRPEALREITRRLREADRAMETAVGERWPKPKAASNMRRNGMRMASVSVVYEVEPYVRDAQDILRELRPVGIVSTKKPRPRAQAKRVSASVIKPMEFVVGETFDEMQRRDPQHAKRWVVLLDGCEHQLAYVEAEAQRRGITVTIIVDFIHVAQYVWGAAKVLVPDDETARRLWVAEKLTHVLWGDASTAAAAMRRSATKRGLPDNERAAVDTCAGYLLKYKAYLRYDEALRDGLPITTGAVEGACRHLVKDRMDITGARWGLETAEAVLRLRGLAASGDIDDYFDFHEARELQRNHLSRYANNKPPALARPGKPLLRVVR